jgi:hypothetical protein
VLACCLCYAGLVCRVRLSVRSLSTLGPRCGLFPVRPLSRWVFGLCFGFFPLRCLLASAYVLLVSYCGGLFILSPSTKVDFWFFVDLGGVFCRRSGLLSVRDLAMSLSSFTSCFLRLVPRGFVVSLFEFTCQSSVDSAAMTCF